MHFCHQADRESPVVVTYNFDSQSSHSPRSLHSEPPNRRDASERTLQWHHAKTQKRRRQHASGMQSFYSKHLALKRHFETPIGAVPCNKGECFKLVHVYEGDECLAEYGVYSSSLSTRRHHRVWLDGVMPETFDAETVRLEWVTDELTPAPERALEPTECENGSNRGQEWFVLFHHGEDEVQMVVFASPEESDTAWKLVRLLMAVGLISSVTHHISRREKAEERAIEACGLDSSMVQDVMAELQKDSTEQEICFTTSGEYMTSIASHFHLADLTCLTEDAWNGEEKATMRLHVERIEHLVGCTITTQWKENPRTATMTNTYLDFEFANAPLTHLREPDNYSLCTFEGMAAIMRREGIDDTYMPEPLKSYVYNENARICKTKAILPPKTRMMQEAQCRQLLTCYWWFRYGYHEIPGLPYKGPPRVAVRRILHCALLYGFFVKLKNPYDKNSGEKLGQGGQIRDFRDKRHVGKKASLKNKNRGKRGKRKTPQDYEPRQKNPKTTKPSSSTLNLLTSVAQKDLESDDEWF